MQFRTNIVLGFYLSFCIIFWLIAPCNILAQTAPKSEVPEKTFNAQTKGKTQTPNMDVETVDKAGEMIGKDIDKLSHYASSKIGKWVEVEVFSGITWLKLLFCIFLLFLVVTIERLLRWLANASIRKISPEVDVIPWRHHFFQSLIKPLSLFIWSYGIYGAFSPLYSHFRTVGGDNHIQFVMQKAAHVGGVIAFFWFILSLVKLLNIYMEKWAAGTESTIDDMLVPIVNKTLRVFIIVIGGVIVIQNLTGLKIGPLLASLGIGGLAVALAAKDSIANFFGTLTILFDKPFKVGERVKIDNHDGVVEDVGFRSTRIRTLTGHLVTIPNEKIVNSGLENIGKRPHIRWLTNISITYDTRPDRVEKAVSIIKEILDNHEGMHPDFPPRVYFNGFNDWSLNIMVTAWYHPAEYWDMQDWLQRTCLEILRRFETEDIEFAFPSSTAYIANADKRYFKLMMLKGQES